MAVPPFEVGAVQLTMKLRSPEVAVTLVGAPGEYGPVVIEVVPAALSPLKFWACTETVNAVNDGIGWGFPTMVQVVGTDWVLKFKLVVQLFPPVIDAV